MHAECRGTPYPTCPKCGGWIAPDPFFAPVTPVLDVLVVLTAAISLIVLLIAVGILSKIPFTADAPGTAGIAFYFFFAPVAALGVLFAAIAAILWTMRRNARRPIKVNP